MAAKPLPPASLIRQRLGYDPTTGALTWSLRPLHDFKTTRAANAWNMRFAGKMAGSTNSAGYVVVGLDGKSYLAHRLILKMLHGVDPAMGDHSDGKPGNNSMTNLRDAPRSVNAKNQKLRRDNRSGFAGVSRYGRAKRWQARIRIDGKLTNLGCFDTAEEAYRAKRAVEVKAGFHRNHGRPQ